MIVASMFQGHCMLWTMGIFLIVTKCNNWDVVFVVHMLYPLLWLRKEQKRKGSLHATLILKRHVEVKHLKLLTTYVENLAIVYDILGSQSKDDESCRVI